MLVTDLLALLRDVRARGNYWIARCPSHDDKRQSLSVRRGRNDAVLLKCHAGCENATIVGALGLRLADLFNDRRRGGDGPRRPVRPVTTIAATYDYTDELGDLLYQSVREEPKAFFQRRPHPTRSETWLYGMLGGWYAPPRSGSGRGWTRIADAESPLPPDRPDAELIPGLPRLVVYHLDAITARRPGTLVIAEGEKDVDRLATIGIQATTNVSGAGKWRQEYAHQLAAAGVRRAVLIPDNDPPGKRHMAAVMASLRMAGIETAWLALPGDVPEKEDVSWWLDHGGEAATLTRLIVEAPSLTEPPADVQALLGASGGEAAPAGIPPPPENALYGLDDGGCLAVRRGQAGQDHMEPLCNFDAWILEDRLRDDGNEITHQFLLQGRLGHAGDLLPDTVVAGSEFRGLSWVLKSWGARAIVYAGSSKQEHLRVALQVRSAPSTIRVYAHTGWRHIDGTPRYLSAAGAVGDPSIRVDLGDYFERFKLPLVPEYAREGMRQSLWNLRNLAPLSVMAALHGIMFRAPLCDVLHAPLTLMLIGRTGITKSSLAAIGLCHYGDFSDDATFPPAWTSTSNSMGETAFRLKDMVVPYDDFYRHRGVDSREMDIKMSQIIRAQGNMTSRGRLNVELEQRKPRPPRGIALITGENYPVGESTLARTLVVEMAGDTIDLDKLREAQRDQPRGLLPHAMAGFVEWLAPQFAEGQLARAVRARFDDLRTLARADASRQHLRVPTTLAHVGVGLDYYLRYAAESGAIGEAERAVLWEEAWHALVSASRTQNTLMDETRPIAVFAELLQSCLLDRRICLLGSYGSTISHKAPPIAIGWADRKRAYILPADGINQLYRAVKDAGETFPLDKDRLLKELGERGILEIGADKRPSKPVRISGHLLRVYVLNRDRLSQLLGHPLIVPGLEHLDEDEPNEQPRETASGGQGNARATPF